MNSFRNRLLVLIVGLVIVTQTVTFFAVAARTQRDVEARAAEQLRSGGSVVQQFMHIRSGQLAAAVAVLAGDFGLRSAVASGEASTMLSAVRNHSTRIGADLVLLIGTDGRILASTAEHSAGTDASLEQLLARAEDERSQAHFMVYGDRPYQFFIAPVRAPDTIAWAAMGFAVDDALARRIRDIAEVEVSVVAYGHDGTRHVASTLPASQRTGLSEPRVGAHAEEAPHLERVGREEYLTYTRALEDNPDSIVMVLQQPMTEVLAPYQDVRRALLVIGGIGIALSAFAGVLLGRGATRPIAELMQAARRIQAGSYQTSVEARGAEEFRSLAATFNAMQQDIAQREARISHDAYHDSLTGLANRAFAERYVDELLRTAPLGELAVIVLDVHNIREINASLGHHLGDEALREVARRLRGNSGPADLVARLAANQFLIVARDCSLERAPLIAEQLGGMLRSGFHLSQVSLEMHVSAGVCHAPTHGDSAATLLRRAQIALEDAGDARTRVGLYRPGRDQEHLRRLSLIADLRQALEQDALTLVYQPKVAVATRSVRSLEALVRWTHPQLGPISPAEFVPLAERTGGTRRLTSWVLTAAIKQMAQWRRDGLEVEVAVNLSAPDILDPTLSDEILATLRAHAVEPTRLVLEITESAVMRDAQLAARNMQLLRIAGVRFAIDDFGTGYSSLSHLSRLPVDELKIDRSFIMHAHERGDDANIVMSTIELAHSMGLKVVAEGVETAEGWNLLRKLGCDYAQGYLISRPLAVADVTGFVREANQLLPASDSTVRQIRALEELSAAKRS
jgi:diguanylate cyclase (GGDEF)-like protein